MKPDNQFHDVTNDVTNIIQTKYVNIITHQCLELPEVVLGGMLHEEFFRYLDALRSQRYDTARDLLLVDKCGETLGRGRGVSI